jgi:hypothetical protein
VLPSAKPAAEKSNAPLKADTAVLPAATQVGVPDVFAIGCRRVAVGGLEPLEAILDAVTNRNGREIAAEP